MPRNRVGGGSKARKLAGELSFLPADEKLRFKPLLVMQAYSHFPGRVRMTGGAGLCSFKAADAIRMGRRSRLTDPGPQDESEGQKRNKKMKLPLHANLLVGKSLFVFDNLSFLNYKFYYVWDGKNRPFLSTANLFLFYHSW